MIGYFGIKDSFCDEISHMGPVLSCDKELKDDRSIVGCD